MDNLPILYSFRRCPYAIRARCALSYAGIKYQHREIELKNKPASMLKLSPKATVPVMYFPDSHNVIDESLDIMLWALAQSDPDNWLLAGSTMQEQIFELVKYNDENFKPNLDAYKYPNRGKNIDEIAARQQAEEFLKILEQKLLQNKFLFSSHLSIADIAIAPFIRQFANVDVNWFKASPYQQLQIWLQDFVESALFNTVMVKHPQWQE